MKMEHKLCDMLRRKMWRGIDVEDGIREVLGESIQRGLGDNWFTVLQLVALTRKSKDQQWLTEFKKVQIAKKKPCCDQTVL